ncbi:MAG: MOSC domain-containing protein [Hyphomonadaceae bacterium]
MKGAIASIYRHPVKGFTPERLTHAMLKAGEGLAFDRVFAVEDGPSGLDAAAPDFIPKMKFTVLAKIAKIAAARTRFDDATGVLSASADGRAIEANLFTEAGRAAFAKWLGAFLGDEARGPLKVLPAPGAHRFFDHPQGHVSLINLASVRELEARTGRAIDPLRFRANVYVDGWPAWAEINAPAARVKLGAAEARVFKPIVRCAATHVDPETAKRDFDLVGALQREFGHAHCGAYLHVENGAVLAEGDEAELCV